MSESSVTTTDGIRLSTRSDGPADAAPLLCCNSLGTGLDLWDPQVPGWSAHRRVLRFDQRGHGDSDAPEGAYHLDELGQDALAVLDAYEVTRADVCGLSLGGVVAQWLAINHPERVDRVVLACTAARVGTQDAWRERAQAVRDGGTAAIADMVMERFFSPAFRERDPRTVARFRQALIDTPDAGYIGSCLALAQADLRAETPQLEAPTLVLAGSADEATPPSVMRELLHAIPSARWEELDGAGHLANLEDPVGFERAVLGHLSNCQCAPAVDLPVTGEVLNC